MSPRFDDLDSRHRDRLAEILTATAVFSTDEIAIALELFDEAYHTPAPTGARETPPAYEFIGAYDDDGALVGYACFGPTPGTEGTFDLYWIAVDPAAQATGCGSSLLAEVERVLARRAGRLVVVETSSRDSYARTRRFYDRCGYVEAARVTSFYGPADDRLIYAKRLRRAAPIASPDSPPPH